MIPKQALLVLNMQTINQRQMKILKLLIGFISLLTGLVIIIYYTHDYPENQYELTERRTYLKFFMKANNKEEVQSRMFYELKEGNSVINDLLITEWALEYKKCNWLDQIERKIDNYKIKKNKKKDNYIGDELYLLELLSKRYEELKNKCGQGN